MCVLVDGTCDIGQHPDVSRVILPFIPGWFADIPVLENPANYFSQAHFDPADVVSILFGSVSAYLAICAMPIKKR